MSHTPNELVGFFDAEQLRAAEVESPHVARIAAEYHDLNREIHRAETNVEPMDDLHIEELRKKRLALLDEIRSFLAKRDA